ncbi:hypothetical protein [Motiliproteus sediminis]|uniref:hypothetical protein n=1 Tax=Motiliproteus sediminis TaxID=1468178 RepID=UPI001AEFAF7B|nr:hypothetical protein [Motiliproteus sediminis]
MAYRISIGLQRLASPRLTALFFVTSAIGALAVAQYGVLATTAMLLPFTLLILNLLAAIVTLPRFRADLPLLVFHLALLALVALFLAARLVYFKGGFILSENTAFEGELQVENSGPLHPRDYRNLRFRNEGFTDALKQGENDNRTYNRVRWWNADGRPQVSVIGNDRPVIVDGYRIFATGFSGYSPVFSWQTDAQPAVLGTIQLGNREGTGFAHAAAWTAPNSQELWFMLERDENAPAPALLGGQIDTRTLAHSLIVRTDDQRIRIRPGESLQLGGATLTYHHLNTWMGYQIVYEPMTPWIIATVATGILSLLWLYGRILFRPLRQGKELHHASLAS